MKELADLGVLIVDCQTTGATPALGAVLELGWGITRAKAGDLEQLQSSWVTLPPGHGVPFQVRRLTGFHERLATDAVTPEGAWQRLRATMEFRDRMPAAIHFAKFELAFLRDWARRFEPEIGFPLDAVCVHAIACRLYPDLPRRSLRALAGFLGHGLDPATRRCLGHVEATAFIWQKLVTELASLGVRNWEELQEWLAAPRPAGSRARKRRYPLPSARYRTLPDEPGVYRMIRSNGDVLYVGKAASLRKRVGSHFTAGSSTTERALEMLTQVHDIQVTPTRTALEAALLENESIKALQPPYNVQLVAGGIPTWYVDRRLDAASSRPDETHRFGPLPSTFSVRALGAIRRLLSGETPHVALRARAVGAPERWAPDETVFAAGLASFVQRHSLEVRCSTADVCRTLGMVAKSLILAAKAGPESKSEGELEPDEADAAGPGSWDPARVLRHLERGVMHGHQLLQRARWLCLLYDSVVVFRDPPSERSRILWVHGGRLVETRDFLPGDLVPDPVSHRPLRERQAAFDRSHYDRLRTLTTELKRVVRDKGTVEIRVGRGRWLRGSTLDGILHWV